MLPSCLALPARRGQTKSSFSRFGAHEEIMDQTLSRIRAATQQLNDVQTELYRRALAPNPEDTHAFLDEPTSLDVLSGFKAAVDELRRFLWFYIDELAKRVGADPDLMMQGYRIRRATEMLRVLSDEPMIAECTSLQDTQSFLEQVVTVVETRLAKSDGG